VGGASQKRFTTKARRHEGKNWTTDWADGTDGKEGLPAFSIRGIRVISVAGHFVARLSKRFQAVDVGDASAIGRRCGKDKLPAGTTPCARQSKMLPRANLILPHRTRHRFNGPATHGLQTRVTKRSSESVGRSALWERG